MSTAARTKPSQSEQSIARVIARRYGDGGIYLPRRQDQRDALRRAIDAGFVSADGFLTRAGRRLVARWEQ
ncbi:MAG: hypothetical protein RLW61_15020 [Gammaproteobacteria bacterium]